MRRVLLAPIIALLVLPVLGVLASAAEPLAADIQHGIVIWDTSITLYKRGAGPHQRCMNINVGSDDVRQILSWNTDNVYLIVYVRDLDPWASNVPALQAQIMYPSQSPGSTMYMSMWINIPHPGVYEITVPSEAIRRASKLYGSIIVQLCVPDWNTNTAAGAPDSFFKVVIDKVVVAPPQGAINDKPQRPVTVTVRPESGGFGDSKALLLGAGIVVVAVIVAVLIARR